MQPAAKYALLALCLGACVGSIAASGRYLDAEYVDVGRVPLRPSRPDLTFRRRSIA